MKKNIYIIIAVLFMMHASTALAGVADTKHNLSSGSSFTYKSATETEVCKFCHTPHASIADTPLWNHKNDVTTFTRFSSATLVVDDNAANPYGYLDADLSGASKLCMGCHDGVTALGALSQVTISDVSPSNYLTATDLRNKHPVSFEYKSGGSNLWGVLDGGVKAGKYGLPNNTVNNTINNPFVSEKWRREGERVECTVCHDPHENKADAADAALLPFWVSSSITGYDSHDSVCVACHNPSFGEYTAFGEYSSL
ncbi:MAG: hypothetical protein RQ824_00245 [bacterium]|nr:hypothetical protein [bacterium]